jgi:hypothetical protein
MGDGCGMEIAGFCDDLPVNLKYASTAKAVITDQRVTRGLFKRLDESIA